MFILLLYIFCFYFVLETKGKSEKEIDIEFGTLKSFEEAEIKHIKHKSFLTHKILDN